MAWNVPFVLLLINNPLWLYHSLLGQSIGLLWHVSFYMCLKTLVMPAIGFSFILIIFSFQSWLFSNLRLILWLFLKTMVHSFHILHCCTLLPLYTASDHPTLPLEIASHFLCLLTLIFSMSMLFVHWQQNSVDLWVILWQLWFSGIQGKILHLLGKMGSEETEEGVTGVHRKKYYKPQAIHLCSLVQFHILPRFPFKTQNFSPPPLKWFQIVLQF